MKTNKKVKKPAKRRAQVRSTFSVARRRAADPKAGRDEVLERFDKGQSIVEFIDFSAGRFVKA